MLLIYRPVAGNGLMLLRFLQVRRLSRIERAQTISEFRVKIWTTVSFKRDHPMKQYNICTAQKPLQPTIHQEVLFVYRLTEYTRVFLKI